VNPAARRQDALILLGPTGAGKSPLGDFLERRGLWNRRCFHFDFGANLRRVAIEGGPGLGDSDVALVRDVLQRNALLEDSQFPIAERILEGYMHRHGLRHGDLIALNGLPRHVGQAAALDQRLRVRLVVLLDCAAATAHSRIRENAGGDRAERRDDSPAEIARKLEIYRTRTAPLLDRYAAEGVQIAAFDVRTSTASEQLADVLEKEYGITDDD
jgi:adenylate kinase